MRIPSSAWKPPLILRTSETGRNSTFDGVVVRGEVRSEGPDGVFGAVVVGVGGFAPQGHDAVQQVGGACRKALVFGVLASLTIV